MGWVWLAGAVGCGGRCGQGQRGWPARLLLLLRLAGVPGHDALGLVVVGLLARVEGALFPDLVQIGDEAAGALGVQRRAGLINYASCAGAFCIQFVLIQGVK